MKKPVMFNEKPVTIRRIVVYIVGLFVMALGISFAVNSNFGVSPVTTLPYVASRVLGISVGTGTIVAYVLFILIELCIYRKHFKVTYILQFPAAIIFGYFTDFTTLIISPLGIPTHWAMQLLFVVVGVVLLGLGLRAYLTADIMAIPPDALAVCLAWAFKKPLPPVKRIFDCCCVAISLAVSLIVFHDWEGLWIGTIIAALGVGTMLKVWSNVFQAQLEKYLYGQKPGEAAKEEATAVEQELPTMETPAAEI